MAKTGKTLKQALAAVDAYGKGLAKEAKADYTVGMSANAAGVAGLAGQTRALTRGLVLSEKQNSAAVQRLSARASGLSGKVSAQVAKTTGMYGAGLGSSIAGAYKPAAATAAATGQIVAGQAKAAGEQQRTAVQVAHIAMQGVAAQNASGQYALAQALQQRNIADNATVGEMTAHLYETKLQENAQWELWKKQQDYATKKADAQTKPAVLRLINEGTDIAGGAAEAWRTNRDADSLDTMNVTQEAANWATNNGYDPQGPEAALFSATLRNLGRDATGDANTPAAWTQAVTTLYSNTPGWNNWGQDALSSGQHKLTGDLWAQYNAYGVSQLPQGGVWNDFTTGLGVIGHNIAQNPGEYAPTFT